MLKMGKVQGPINIVYFESMKQNMRKNYVIKKYYLSQFELKLRIKDIGWDWLSLVKNFLM